MKNLSNTFASAINHSNTMKTKSLAAALLAMMVVATAHSQPFNSGSTGSYGPMLIGSNTTLNVPADGIFNCTTIVVSNGATLTFNRNALNTPVYLLATNDVTITGAINVSGSSPSGGSPGLGGPGGFDGGYGGFGVGPNTKGGDGQGPGGGRNTNPNWTAVHTSSVQANTNVYGNALLSPLIGGSGGAGFDGNPGTGGGGGGGAILIASNTKITVNGSVSANGANSGSGGAIRLVSPLVNGTGSLNTTAGGIGYGGSQGRIRVDCQDRYAFRSLTMNGLATRGAQMFVFPSPIPRLDIVQAAGTNIVEGFAGPVLVDLPAGSSTNRTVTIQARDFTNSVPVRIVVIPENRASLTYDVTITMTNNPAQLVVPVIIPDGTVSRINAWNR